MKLIIILLCLAIIKYLKINMPRIAWVEQYLIFLHEKLEKLGFSNPIFEIITAVAIPTLALLLLNDISRTWFGGIADFMISFIVLLYCLDNSIWPGLFETTPFTVSSAEPGNMVTKTLWQSHEYLFAIIFWFMVFGPVGAFIYRLIILFKDSIMMQSSELHQAIAEVQAFVDWLPVRFVSLGFILAGNFNRSFNYWYDLVFSGRKQNYTLLTQTGLLALGVEAIDNMNVDSIPQKDIKNLLKRTLIIYLVVIALVTLA